MGINFKGEAMPDDIAISRWFSESSGSFGTFLLVVWKNSSLAIEIVQAGGFGSV
jgi:hypothetical protein